MQKKNEHQTIYELKPDGNYLVWSELDIDDEYAAVIASPTFKESFGDLLMRKLLNTPQVRKSRKQKVHAYDKKGNRFFVEYTDKRLKDRTLRILSRSDGEKVRLLWEKRHS